MPDDVITQDALDAAAAASAPSEAPPAYEAPSQAGSAINAALCAAIVEAEHATRDGWNDHQKYRYASAEEIFGVARCALSNNGLVLKAGFPTIRAGREGELFWRAKRGEKGAYVRLGMVMVRSYRLLHVSGESLDLGEQEWPIVAEAGRPEDKAFAAADTASLSYAMRDLLQLPRVEKGTGLDDSDRKHEGRETKPAKTKGGKAQKKRKEERKAGVKDLLTLLVAAQKKTGEEGFKSILKVGKGKGLGAPQLKLLHSYCAALVLHRKHGRVPEGADGLSEAQVGGLAEARKLLAANDCADYFATPEEAKVTNDASAESSVQEDEDDAAWLQCILSAAAQLNFETDDVDQFFRDAEADVVAAGGDPANNAALTILHAYLRSRRPGAAQGDDAPGARWVRRANEIIAAASDPEVTPKEMQRLFVTAVLDVRAAETAALENRRLKWVESLGGPDSQRYRDLVAYGVALEARRKGREPRLTTRQVAGVRRAVEALSAVGEADGLEMVRENEAAE